MSIYLPVALCFRAFTSYNGSRVPMSLFAPEPGASTAAIGVRFTMVNFMHLAIPLVFAAMSSAAGLIPVFVSNAMLLFGGSWRSRKGAKT